MYFYDVKDIKLYTKIYYIYLLYFIFQVVHPCSYQFHLRRRLPDECNARSLVSVPRLV